MSRCSNQIESVGLRKCPYYRYLIEKVTSTDVRTTNISQSLPTKWRKTADMKKLRHCQAVYSVVCLSVTCEPCKNGCTDRHAVWVMDLAGPKERRCALAPLANTIEPSICGDDAAFLSNYFYHLLLWSIFLIFFSIFGSVR